ncbi:hypothetical protein B0H13DRAFT_2041623 [Mycena leptocephala]|nr:hypothetical protein B0H13DRAFT_2041623 [Mycena leptocephala]
MHLTNSTFHFHGGVGGSGGGAGAQGTGGNGGTGEGPTVKIDSVENLHMNDQGLGIHLLHRAVALEALHDSAENFPQPKCHPETRTELLDNLYNWVIDPNSEHPIHWLHGGDARTGSLKEWTWR